MSAIPLAPSTPEELAAALAESAAAGRTIRVEGAGTKRRLGGPLAESDVAVSTLGLGRLLAYEPADLTVSVEAGMPWAELTRLLGERGQILPLDPPFAAKATVGGALAADSSGPRRRRYGTGRDLVIGMSFATLEGKIVRSGGMVVKNVSGLDMAKPLIGSFGTLAAIASVNFRVFPRPETSATFVFPGESAAKIDGLRRALVGGAAQPFALDWLNAAAGLGLGLEFEAPHALAALAEGSAAVVARYRKEYRAAAARAGVETVEPEPEAAERIWTSLREFPATALEARPDGVLVRVSTVVSRLTEAISAVPADGWMLARAANGVVSLSLPGIESAAATVRQLRAAGFPTLVETPTAATGLEQWAEPGPAFAVMQRLKETFDPHRRLGPGRLWGRI